MGRQDYAHWNEEADYMWWQEEGRHIEDEPFEDDYDRFMADAYYEELAERAEEAASNG